MNESQKRFHYQKKKIKNCATLLHGANITRLCNIYSYQKIMQVIILNSGGGLYDIIDILFDTRYVVIYKNIS